MQHAISNAGALEAAHYESNARGEALEIAQSRRESLSEQIIDRFDGKDVMTAFDIVSEFDPNKMHRLYEALAILPQLDITKIEDRQLRNLVIAFAPVAHYYAGYMAAKELGA